MKIGDYVKIKNPRNDGERRIFILTRVPDGRWEYYHVEWTEDEGMIRQCFKRNELVYATKDEIMVELL